MKRLEGVAEDWKLKAEGEEGRARKLQEELLLGQDKLEGLDGQVLFLKSLQEEVTRKTSTQQEQGEAEGLTAGERLDVSTSSEPQAKEEVGEQKTTRESLALEVNELKDQPHVSHSTTRASQSRAASLPLVSSTKSLQLSLKRPVDLEADYDQQKKARTNIITEVSSRPTGQGGGSFEMESDISLHVEAGEERGQVKCSSQDSGDQDVEEKALDGELEENNNHTRTDEGVGVCSSSLQTLKHVCDDCQSVFTQAAALLNHQAVVERCKRVKEPKTQEFTCQRCFRQFSSKSNWSKHVTFVLDCFVKKKHRENRTVEEADLLEVHGPQEELCLETPAEVDSSPVVLPAQSLPGLEVEEAPEGETEGDHCYAMSSTQAPEQRPSTLNPSQPTQVNSG